MRRGSESKQPWGLTFSRAAESPPREAEKLRDRFLLLFFGSLAIGLLLRITAINSGLSIDDYAQVRDYAHSLGPHYLWEARWSLAGLEYLAGSLGLTITTSSAFFSLLLIAAQSFFIASLLYSFFPSMPAWSQLAGATVILAHPYWAELYTFKLASLGLTLTYFLLGIVVFLASRESEFQKSGLAFNSLMVLVVFSAYQSMLNLLIVVVFAGVLQMASFSSKTEIDYLKARRRTTRLFFATVIGGSLYVIISVAIRVATPIEFSGRTSVLGLSGTQQRVGQVTELIGFMFLEDEPIFPFGSKMLYMGVVLVSVLTVLFAVFRTKRSSNIAILLGLVLAFPFVSVGVSLILSEWWPSPRVLQHQGLLLGLIFMLGLSMVKSAVIKRGLILGSGAVLAVGAALSAQVFFDQRTINRLDWTAANQMHAALQSQVGYQSAERIAFHGRFFRYPVPLKTTYMDLNISAFGPAWSQQPMFEFATGRVFAQATPEDRMIAADFCGESGAWPSPSALIVADDLVIICLSP